MPLRDPVFNPPFNIIRASHVELGVADIARSRAFYVDCLGYLVSDEETLRDAGQGGFEIRTLIAVAGACEGHGGEIWFCEPIPIFATSGFAGVMDVSEAAAAKAA